MNKNMYITINRSSDKITVELIDENGLNFFRGDMSKPDFADVVTGLCERKVKIDSMISPENLSLINRDYRDSGILLDTDVFYHKTGTKWIYAELIEKLDFIKSAIPDGYVLASDGISTKQDVYGTHKITVRKYE